MHFQDVGHRGMFPVIGSEVAVFQVQVLVEVALLALADVHHSSE